MDTATSSDFVTPKPVTRKQFRDMVRPGGRHSLQQRNKALNRVCGDHGATAKLLQFFDGV